MRFLLTFVLTTPPTPKAGMILPILASALFAQSLTTLLVLPSAPRQPAPGRLYRSSPSKWSGVLNICTAAGVTNWAADAADMYFRTSDDMCRSKRGARRGGRLKEANMVRQSRTVKRAKVGSGTGRGEDADELKSWVKRLSLYRQSARFAELVARNFGVPAVVIVGGLFRKVDVAVSIVFAVR